MAVMNRGAMIALAVGIGAAVAASGSVAHNEPMPKGKMSASAHAAHMRHENFEKLGGAFKGLNDELRKGEPDRALVARHAQTMATLTNALPGWFPKGSGVEARPKSEAKANIWTDPTDFAAKASASQVQVSKLNQAAVAGDFAAVRAQVRPVGGTCKGCHDVYRQEKKKS